MSDESILDYLNNKSCPYCQEKLLLSYNDGLFPKYKCVSDNFKMWFSKNTQNWYSFEICYSETEVIVAWRHVNQIQYRNYVTDPNVTFPVLPIFDIFKVPRKQAIDKMKKYVIFS